MDEEKAPEEIKKDDANEDPEERLQSEEVLELE